MPSGKTESRLYMGALLAAVLIVYGNSLWNDFTMDDLQVYVVHNPQVTNPSLRGLFRAHAVSKVFRPVTFATFALDWKLSGGRPFEFHLVNLLLHAGVCVLLYLVLQMLLQALPRGGIVAFCAALLFAVHPIHTEAVTSIAGRAELLAAGFLLAAWILHLKDRPIAALACFVLAVLSKESAIVLLPLVLIGDYVCGRWKPAWRYAAIGIVSLLYIGVLWKVQGGRFGPTEIAPLENPLVGLSFWPRVLNALRVMWKYIALQFYPARLSCDYSYHDIALYFDWRHLLPAALGAIAVIGAWAWAMWKHNALLAVAGGIYLAGFATTANIALPIGTIMGERLAYLPSAGFCLLLAAAWAWLERRQRKLAFGILAVVIAALGVRTVIRNRDWKDNVALFSAAVRVAPDNPKMRNALGGSYEYEGIAYMRMGQLDLAAKDLHAAVQMNPNRAETLEAFGLVEARRGNYQSAGPALEKAFYMVDRTNSSYDEMAVNLAAAYMATNHVDGALDLLDKEIVEAPSFARAWAVRALIRYQKGDAVGAAADAETALRLDPANAQARNVLRLLGGAGHRSSP